MLILSSEFTVSIPHIEPSLALQKNMKELEYLSEFLWMCYGNLCTTYGVYMEMKFLHGVKSSKNGIFNMEFS